MYTYTHTHTHTHIYIYIYESKVHFKLKYVNIVNTKCSHP